MNSLINSSKKKAIDTNVVIYAIENQDLAKSEIAINLMLEKPFISNQVISETFHLLRSKFKRNENF